MHTKALMKISSLWIVLILLNLSYLIYAQTGEGEIENWVEARVICTTTDNWLLQVEVSANVSAVYLFPDVSGAWVWFIGEAKTRRFWVDKDNQNVSIRVEVGEMGDYSADSVFLEDAAVCEISDASVAMNECLGIALADFIAMTNYEPLGDGFEVDGQAYYFHENLSFFVPVDAVWQWDLYVDGRHLLRFEQNEISECRVTEVYPQ